ncbi:hypothetical protein EV383_2997 [Pseudonocardia sediminis]|uniref:Uncharacterized protein n=1 Tax=Pseudonocardia sediminis TaxID=1397368 RepID=A0A4Q7UYF8_PSEST|nr:hypothetical protein EV383_2997 [Pseudonocardia sediminis]
MARVGAAGVAAVGVAAAWGPVSVRARRDRTGTVPVADSGVTGAAAGSRREPFAGGTASRGTPFAAVPLAAVPLAGAPFVRAPLRGAPFAGAVVGGAPFGRAPFGRAPFVGGPSGIRFGPDGRSPRGVPPARGRPRVTGPAPSVPFGAGGPAGAPGSRGTVPPRTRMPTRAVPVAPARPGPVSAPERGEAGVGVAAGRSAGPSGTACPPLRPPPRPRSGSEAPSRPPASGRRREGVAPVPGRSASSRRRSGRSSRRSVSPRVTCACWTRPCWPARPWAVRPSAARPSGARRSGVRPSVARPSGPPLRRRRPPRSSVEPDDRGGGGVVGPGTRLLLSRLASAPAGLLAPARVGRSRGDNEAVGGPGMPLDQRHSNVGIRGKHCAGS